MRTRTSGRAASAIDQLEARAAQAGASIIRAISAYRSQRMRRIAIAAAIVVVLFGLGGFVGVPLVAQYVVAGRLGASLHRPVNMARVRFNPFTLRLNIDKLHIAERGAAESFVDIGHLRVKVSWTSLFRLAPVVGEVALDRPAIHIVRTGEQRFNFSDLLEGPARAPKPNAKPQRFAVSNIQIHDGEVRIDDKVLGAQHAVEHIELDIPFIANLPADVDIFVQPLLQMVVDGSPMRIAGKAKPFALPPESVIDLNLHKLSLPRYLGYAPQKLPIRIPQGTLSSRMRIHFVNAPGAPVIRIGGNLALDHLDVRDAADAPLVGFNHLAIALTQVEPLESITHLRKIYLDGLTVHAVRNADGSLNFASLAPGKPASTASAAAPAAAAPQPTSTATGPAMTPAAATTPAAMSAQITTNAPPSAPAAPASAAKPVSPFDLSIDALELTNGAILISDNSTAPPAALEIGSLHVGLKDLRTVGQRAPAPYDLSATLGGGGSIAVKGTIDLAQSQAATDISLSAIDLPALQAFAAPVLAATVASGKLNAQASVKTSFGGGHFNLHAEPAGISLDQFELRAPNESESPLGWNKLSVSIGEADLAARHATVTEVRSDGLHLFVRRAHDGRLSLASLVRAAAPPPAVNAASS
ncbi:MAG TPA: DUF748 domain-containing protein, partial [Candidatus Binataceae bacterium]|nr:DUF748 domain-containing protein [Candidatus Binataceae bacterium]